MAVHVLAVLEADVLHPLLRPPGAQGDQEPRTEISQIRTLWGWKLVCFIQFIGGTILKLDEF